MNVQYKMYNSLLVALLFIGCGEDETLPAIMTNTVAGNTAMQDMSSASTMTTSDTSANEPPANEWSDENMNMAGETTPVTPPPPPVAGEMMGEMTAGETSPVQPVAGETTMPSTEQTPGVTGEVSCGNTSCDLSTNVCCVGLTGEECQSGDMCPDFSAPKVCDGPEDCESGQNCCVSFPAGSSCKAACDPNALELTLCHQDAECSNGQVCARCVYPGNSIVQICNAPGEVALGAMSCN